MPPKIVAPWSVEQVDALNAYQHSDRFHPFTCGNDRHDERHKAVAAERGDGDPGLLVAYADGWRCPACDYSQTWAYAFMAEPVV